MPKNMFATPSLKAAAFLIEMMGGMTFLRTVGGTNVQQYKGGVRFTLPNYLAKRQINRISIVPCEVVGLFDVIYSNKTKDAAGQSKEVVIAEDSKVPVVQLDVAFTAMTGLVLDLT